MAAPRYGLFGLSNYAELSVLLIHQNGGLVPEFMIRVSFVVLFLDLQYHEMNLASGAQTIRLGWAGPVSYLHGRATLTGCFFCTFTSPFTLQTSPFKLLLSLLGFKGVDLLE